MRFFKDEDGASAVEYGILVGLIAAVVIIAVGVVGGKANNAFNYTDSQMSGAPFVGST